MLDGCPGGAGGDEDHRGDAKLPKHFLRFTLNVVYNGKHGSGRIRLSLGQECLQALKQLVVGKRRCRCRRRDGGDFEERGLEERGRDRGGKIRFKEEGDMVISGDEVLAKLQAREEMALPIFGHYKNLSTHGQ